jgi:CubicO group peptidase (beta-lactamase class C family)
MPNLPIKNFPYNFPKVIDLLIHHSGVDSNRYYDKYMLLGHEELYKAFVHNITGVGEPNQKYEYNCSNYILLGLIIEAITKQPLNIIAKKYIFDKLTLNDTSWGIPLQHTLNDVVTPRLKTTHGATPKELVSQEIWNLHLNDQLPSDETARWVLPYCIGNAGMFSNLKDLSKIARFILSKPFSSSSMNLLNTNQSPKGSHPRTCGFDYEDEGVFSPNTIHHTGWSGQSLWIDFEKNLFVIVLTCRSNILDGQRKARLEIAKAALNELKIITDISCF